jgi:hypothetical protein
MSAVIADIRIALGNSSFVPQCVNSTSDPCCGLHEWPVFLLRGGTKYVALAAFPALRAHAAQITNLQIGIIQDLRCAINELTVCGRSRPWIPRLRWRSISSHLQQIPCSYAAYVTKAVIRIQDQMRNSNHLFSAAAPMVASA